MGEFVESRLFDARRGYNVLGGPPQRVQHSLALFGARRRKPCRGSRRLQRLWPHEAAVVG
jgi:hypothetical protein